MKALRSSILAVAGLAIAAASIPALVMKGPPPALAVAPRPRLRVLGGTDRRGCGPDFGGTGWSVRQGQRMARKRRNQLRHRAACKGAR
jgi:hypothetical protein